MRRLYRYWRRLVKNIMYEGLPRGVWWSVLSCVAYSAFSMNMTFSNKAILSVFKFQFPIFLLFFQHIFTLVIVLSARSAGVIDFTPIQLANVKKWYPVNLLFILMLVSGSYALKLLSVPMITIFKNIATTFTAIGDFLIFNQKLNTEIVCSIFLMVLSSMVAGINDLAFDFTGYIWMAVNCVVSAAYVLYMKYAMKQTQLTEWGMVYYNNVLAIPTVVPLLIYSGELQGVVASFGEFTTWTYLVILWTGVSGFLLSITSFWAVRTTSPTTYSMVGSLNKIPLTILGFIFFKTPVNVYGGVSITTGLVAGTLYSIVKQKSLFRAEVLPIRRKIDV